MHPPAKTSAAPFKELLARFLRRLQPSRFAIRVIAIVTFAFFLATAFRSGWTTPQTDFQNYYTAARAVRAGQPLRSYYDWTWFARQMNYAGEGVQLGSYVPQTPLTMLPLVPFAGLSLQHAKQAWLVLNLIFLLAAIALLAKLTEYHPETIWILAFCGYFSLRTNFLYGQYYVFLLFLLTSGFYLLRQKMELPAGFVTGLAFGLKLYGGPFLLYFLIRKQWKALLGMIVAGAILFGVAIALFGFSDLCFYATRILPRSLEAGAVDPYSPGVPTVSSLLHRAFLPESELNPCPLWRAPWLFFFLQPFVSLGIVAMLILGTLERRASAQFCFAWFAIAGVLLSTSASSYTYIVLLLPVVLLLPEAPTVRGAVIVLLYLLLTLPLHPVWLFPKVWLLLALFVVAGAGSLQGIGLRKVLLALTIVAVLSFAVARRNVHSYDAEPAQHFEPVALETGAIFSSSPVVSSAGIFYQSMGKDRYVLRWLHAERNDELAFPGHALDPRLAPDGRSIDFELVADGASTMMRFEPAAGRAYPLPIPVSPGSTVESDSPDGKWRAIETWRDGGRQIVLRGTSSGAEVLLTGGHCSNTSPAWAPDSGSVLFASDCSRGIGLPSLYRAAVP